VGAVAIQSLEPCILSYLVLHGLHSCCSSYKSPLHKACRLYWQTSAWKAMRPASFASSSMKLAISDVEAMLENCPYDSFPSLILSSFHKNRQAFLVATPHKKKSTSWRTTTQWAKQGEKVGGRKTQSYQLADSKCCLLQQIWRGLGQYKGKEHNKLHSKGLHGTCHEKIDLVKNGPPGLNFFEIFGPAHQIEHHTFFPSIIGLPPI